MARTLSKNEARRYYDRFGAKQDQQGFYEDRPLGRLIELGKFSEAEHVLEFGCGTGRLYEKTHAEDVAGHVRGVRAIDNKISVTEEERLSDTELQTAIQNRLKHNQETSFCGDDIRVEVLNGVAVLSGSVDMAIERYQAERVAFHTAGIWKVENRLVIEGVDYPWEEWQREVPKDFDGLFFPRCYFNYG